MNLVDIDHAHQSMKRNSTHGCGSAIGIWPLANNKIVGWRYQDARPIYHLQKGTSYIGCVELNNSDCNCMNTTLFFHISDVNQQQDENSSVVDLATNTSGLSLNNSDDADNSKSDKIASSIKGSTYSEQYQENLVSCRKNIVQNNAMSI